MVSNGSYYILLRFFLPLAVIFAGILFNPQLSLAVLSDNFESYSVGSLETATANVWNETNTGDWDIVSSPVYTGSRALHCSSNVCGTPTTSAVSINSYNRYIHGGYIYNEGRSQYVSLYDSNSDIKLRVRFDNDGDWIRAENDVTSDSTVNSYATSSWIYYQIDIDLVNEKFRVNVDDGPFTTWVDFWSTSTGTFEYWSLNSFSATPGTSIAFDNFGTNSTGIVDSVIPPSTQDYIVLTHPISGGNTPYETTFFGELNFATTSQPVVSYRVGFISQTGIDYDSLVVEASTTNNFEYEFSHDVSFQNDDIVYVRAYLYECDLPIGTCLPSYISSEYEWWVSADGNPTGVVDLGVFRTGTTTFCGTQSSALDFAWGTCMALRLLFVPNESSINYFTSRAAIATGTAPFSYVYDGSHYLTDLTAYSTSSWSFGFPTTSVIFPGQIILSSATVESSFSYSLVYAMLGVVTYALIPFYVWRRRDALLKR